MPRASPRRRHPFAPRCTHLTMTRLYTTELVCESCRRPGPAGWLYQCSQHQEDFIEHLGISGRLAQMDELSLAFISQMDLRKGTPAAREKPLSLLDELSDPQIQQYSAAQIVSLLRQRERVRLLIQEETLRFNQAVMMQQLSATIKNINININNINHDISSSGEDDNNIKSKSNGNEDDNNDKDKDNNNDGDIKLEPLPDDFRTPWNGGSYQECRYIVCPRCRPACALRATLSINAIVGGEIPPTAATGYGFHITGGRPVMDAGIMRNLGCRSVPLPSSGSSVQDSQKSSRSSATSNGLDVLENQKPCNALADDDDDDDKTDSLEYSDPDEEEDEMILSWPEPPTAPVGSLRPPPGFETAAAVSVNVGGGGGAGVMAWARPPTPFFATDVVTQV